MRVVAGELRGRRIEAPPGTDTRPTTDKVREATFNALGSLDLVRDAVVVDLFAGSGALGIEAAQMSLQLRGVHPRVPICLDEEARARVAHRRVAEPSQHLLARVDAVPPVWVFGGLACVQQTKIARRARLDRGKLVARRRDIFGRRIGGGSRIAPDRIADRRGEQGEGGDQDRAVDAGKPTRLFGLDPIGPAHFCPHEK